MGLNGTALGAWSMLVISVGFHLTADIIQAIKGGK